jgi:hypothetical protein
MCCLLFVWSAKNDQQVGGGSVVSTLESPGLVPRQSAFEIDIRNPLRGKRASGPAEVSVETKKRNVELASMISQISFQSIHEIGASKFFGPIQKGEALAFPALGSPNPISITQR